jgi:hypothetical protein
VVTSLLPSRTFSHLLLKSQININWHKDVFFTLTWIKKLHSQEAATSYLILRWKSTLHHKLSAVSYCYITVSTQLRYLSPWCWTTAVKPITHTKETTIQECKHSNKHTQLKSVQYFSDSFKLRRKHECKISFQCHIHKEAVASRGCCM